MSRTILVTGANGFVGRAVCAEVARQGYSVRAAVREASRGAALPGELAVVGHIGADTDWTDALDGVDAVIHVAARVHVMKETEADGLAAFRAVNVAGTQALAVAAAARRVKRLLYVSSIKVNGEQTRERPFTADDTPDPQDPYGVSKSEAEQCLWKLAGHGALEVVVVRPPLVYGPGVGGNFLRLMKLLANGAPLPLGAVRNRRSMIYVANLASALVAAAMHPRAAGNTYLASDGEDLSTPDLVRRLGGAMGARARLLNVPPALLTIAATVTGKRAEAGRLTGSLVVDSSPLRETLGWVPQYSAQEGLQATGRWFTSASSS